jgi:hypothetical protein
MKREDTRKTLVTKARQEATFDNLPKNATPQGKTKIHNNPLTHTTKEDELIIISFRLLPKRMHFSNLHLTCT